MLEDRVESAGVGRDPGAITAAEFALLRDLIYRRSGILLGRKKAALVVARLSKRLRALRLPTFEAYYAHLMGGSDAHELQRMLDCIVTNETRFFREPGQFEFLETEVYPDWRRAAERGERPKRIRAWSAACSTGEEAYSLAMSLLWHFPFEDGWIMEVLGTDLSTRAIETALAGVWSSAQARHVPHRYLTRFMRRGTRAQEGKMSAGPDLRAAVRFGQLNLHSDSYPPIGRFDLILCRNVLIYFDEGARRAALGRLAGHLSPDGCLALGHAESPGRALDEMDRIGAMVYRSRNGRGRGARVRGGGNGRPRAAISGRVA